MNDNKHGRGRAVVLFAVYIIACVGISAWQFASGFKTLHAMRSGTVTASSETAASTPSADEITATATPEVSAEPTECVHEYGDWVTLVAPTATSNGLDERVCKLCGAVEERETNPSPTIDTSPGNESIYEMFDLINEAREAAGLSAVSYCYDIQSAADLRAQELNEYYDMQHNRPDGREAVTVFYDLNISYTMLGENYTLGPPNAEMAMQAFMNSESHKELILNPNATAVAISVAPNDEFGLSWVQIFV